MIKLDQKNVAQVHNSRHVLLQFYKVPLTILAGICPTKLISHINLRLHREEVEGVRFQVVISYNLLIVISGLTIEAKSQKSAKEKLLPGERWEIIFHRCQLWPPGLPLWSCCARLGCTHLPLHDNSELCRKFSRDSKSYISLSDRNEEDQGWRVLLNITWVDILKS